MRAIAASLQHPPCSRKYQRRREASRGPAARRPEKVDQEPIQTGLGQVGMLMASASDHLLALADMIDPFAVWASRTVARGGAAALAAGSSSLTCDLTESG